MSWSSVVAIGGGWLPLLPLGLLAGLLSGLLGIGGGLIFSPLLLLLGLEPHQALATSTLAIVPTTMAGGWTHLRSGLLPWKAIAAIGSGALAGGLLFSQAGQNLAGWLLLSLQALMYGVLMVVISPRTSSEVTDALLLPPGRLAGLLGVGLVAGWSTGLLGGGGGLVMVPLMVRFLGIRVHQAIRLSTLAVCASAVVASSTFLRDGRADLTMGLLLGGVAALAARWSAARLQRISEGRLVVLLRLLCAILALDSGRRAIMVLLAASGS